MFSKNPWFSGEDFPRNPMMSVVRGILRGWSAGFRHKAGPKSAASYQVAGHLPGPGG